MKKTNQYFQEALSDFTYDAASGRAIRHLVDAGFTTTQIVQRLNYPTPFHKVRHTATDHLKKTGILLDELPLSPACLHLISLRPDSESRLFSFLSQCVSRNGEAYAYISCPFGIRSDRGNQENTKLLSILTAREREYLEGIEWGPGIMYHRLNRRMLEIGVQLAVCSDAFSFYFLNSQEQVQVKHTD